MTEQFDPVSVVMPNFNGACYLGEAIRSVLGQDVPSLELLVCDDGSSDESVPLINSFAQQDPRVRLLVNDRGKGPAAARNFATATATGRYIAFLDSDDIWEPGKLPRQLALMTSKGAALSYTALRKMDENGDFISDMIPVPEEVGYRTLLKSNVIACSSAVYDVGMAGKRFMPFVDKSEDFPLWLGILRDGYGAAGISEPLLRYRVHPASYSANKLRAAKSYWTILRDIENLNIAESSYYFANYAIISGAKFLKKK